MAGPKLSLTRLLYISNLPLSGKHIAPANAEPSLFGQELLYINVQAENSVVPVQEMLDIDGFVLTADPLLK